MDEEREDCCDDKLLLKVWDEEPNRVVDELDEAESEGEGEVDAETDSFGDRA